MVVRYALAPAVSLGFFAGGAIYWAIWWQLLPRLGHYTLHATPELLSDGTKITSFEKRGRQ